MLSAVNCSFRMMATGLVYQLKLVTMGLDLIGPSLCILGIDLKIGKLGGSFICVFMNTASLGVHER